MKNRPLSVTIFSCIIAAAGAVGLVYHLTEFKGLHPFPYDLLWVSLVRLAAIVGGIYMLRGRNWARWLSLAWLAFHVVLSAFHSWDELLIHAVLFAAFSAVLLRPPAAQYFRATRAVGAQP